MLPLQEQCDAQKVCRARLEIDLLGGALSGDGRPGAKAKSRMTEEGDAHYLLELRHVPMPAERRRRPILGDHRVLNALLRNCGPARKPRPQGLQELGNGWPVRELLVGEVITAPEAHDAPPRAPFLVLRFLEGQRADDLQQLRLLGNAQELRVVSEPGRSGGRRCEQVRLDHSNSMHNASRSYSLKHGSISPGTCGILDNAGLDWARFRMGPESHVRRASESLERSINAPPTRRNRHAEYVAAPQCTARTPARRARHSRRAGPAGRSSGGARARNRCRPGELVPVIESRLVRISRAQPSSASTIRR